jgi:hypothetical protein
MLARARGDPVRARDVRRSYAPDIAYILEKVLPKVRQIAWQAQARLTARYPALAARGKRINVRMSAVPLTAPEASQPT